MDERQNIKQQYKPQRPQNIQSVQNTLNAQATENLSQMPYNGRIPTSFEPPVKPKSHKRTIIAVVLLVLLLGGIGGGAFVLLGSNKDEPETKTTSNNQQTISAPNISQSLLEQSGNINGIAVGYLKKQTTSTKKTSLNTDSLRDMLLPKASAQTSDSADPPANSATSDNTTSTDDAANSADTGSSGPTKTPTSDDATQPAGQDETDTTSESNVTKTDTPTLADYDPIVFYSKDQNIYSLNTASKGSQQITQDTGSEPVFSSITQQLAYQKTCSVYSTPLPQSSDEHTLIIEGVDYQGSGTFSKDVVCYKPVAWSPDGTKLAMSGMYSLNDPSLGLVSFNDIYIYDQKTKDIEKFSPPEPYNTTRHFFWTDNTHLAAQYIQSGQYASTIKEDPFIVTTTSQSITPLTLRESLKLDAIQNVGGQFYTFDSSNTSLLASQTIDGDFKEVVKTQGNSGTFLLKADSSNALSDVLLLSGQAGLENSFKLLDFKTATSEMTELYNPNAFSAYMLGWGKDFDEVIYMAVLSGKSEVQQYTISTNKNETLVPDLPLQ